MANNTRYSRTFVTITLLLLLVVLLSVTRLRLLATQIEQVTVRWDISTETSSKRALSLDQVVRKELATATQPQVLNQLQQTERLVSTRRLWVDRCETRQQDFENFVTWYKDRQENLVHTMIAAPDEPTGWRYASESTGHRIAGRPQSSASGVSYYDAYAYCMASGGRLPSEIEWQLIAGGKESRLYPWGNEYSKEHGQAWPYRDGALNAAQICALHSKTDTPEGIHDLANGVMEWSTPAVALQQLLQPLPEKASVHGALPDGQTGRRVHALNATVHRLPKTLRSHRVGFRCVYERQPVRATLWDARYSVRALDSGEYPIGLPSDAQLPRLLSVLPPERLEQVLKNMPASDISGDFVNGQAAYRIDADWRINVAQCEIQRKHYQLFLQDPLVRMGFFSNEQEPEDTDYMPSDWNRQLLQPELPVVGVNWWSAYAFSRWVGGRLPSSEEWRAIATSQERNLYPWGNNYSPQYSMNADLAQATVSACGEFPNDLSDSGVYDMAANVSEWTSSLTADKGTYLMWVSGGSFLLPGKETAKTNFQRAVPLNHRAGDIGFRVVFD